MPTVRSLNQPRPAQEYPAYMDVELSGKPPVEMVLENVNVMLWLRDREYTMAILPLRICDGGKSDVTPGSLLDASRLSADIPNPPDTEYLLDAAYDTVADTPSPRS
jgi:hypothetical protein